jgi:hypothetical protein
MEIPMAVSFGSISHGTLRDVDLLQSFSSELEDRAKESIINSHYHNKRKGEFFGVSISDAVKHLVLVGQAEAYAEVIENDSEAEVSDLIQELFDALDSYAPEYGYFGANEGDGSDFGYWPIDIEEMKQQILDGDGIVIDDLNAIPKKFLGEILYINERGNTTFYVRHKKGAIVKLKEVWSIV